jgi:hypothetical protein
MEEIRIGEAGIPRGMLGNVLQRFLVIPAEEQQLIGVIVVLGGGELII